MILAWMVYLGLDPGAAGFKAQTNPLSYGGTPTIKLLFVVSGCGSVSKAVTSNTRGSLYTTRHRRSFYGTLLTVNCIEKTKKRPGMAPQKIIVCCAIYYGSIYLNGFHLWKDLR